MAMVKKAKTKKKKENRNPNKRINHVEFYFSFNGYKCNLHFWHAQHEFPFFAHLYRQTEFDRPRVLRKTDLLVLVEACTAFVANENLNIF